MKRSRGISGGRPGSDRWGPWLTNSRLHLTVMPTESCNFRCIYCYESVRRGRMRPEVLQGLKRLLRRRAAGLQLLELSWFGGEPLLAPDIVLDVMEHLRGLRASHPSLVVDSDITTNAWFLTPALAARLLGLGVSTYQVSLDGPPAWHDRKRVLPGGRGTFDRIWGNLCRMRERDDPFRVVLRVHLDRENVHAMPVLLDMIAAEFADDARFELFARPISRLGGPRDGSLPTFESAEEERAAVERVRALAVARGIRLRARAPGPSICYAARGNSFLVRADGSLNKCTIALEHPGNQVGWLRPDGTVEIDAARVEPWVRGLFSGDEDELRCPMRGLADRAPGAAADPMATGDRE